MLASDVNNQQFAGAMDPDSVMYAEFHIVPVLQPFESAREGREIWKDVIYCKYGLQGGTLNVQDVPLREGHKYRFPKQWAFFQSKHSGDSRELGTPVSEWPILSPADAENLKAMKFFTIEGIAGSSDLQLQAMGMGVAGVSPYVLRAKAQAYLNAAKDTALPQKQAEDIEALKKQVADLTAMVAAKPGKKEKKGWSPEERAAAGKRLRDAREAKKVKPNGINPTSAS